MTLCIYWLVNYFGSLYFYIKIVSSVAHKTRPVVICNLKTEMFEVLNSF